MSLWIVVWNLWENWPTKWPTPGKTHANVRPDSCCDCDLNSCKYCRCPKTHCYCYRNRNRPFSFRSPVAACLKCILASRGRSHSLVFVLFDSDAGWSRCCILLVLLSMLLGLEDKWFAIQNAGIIAKNIGFARSLVVFYPYLAF